MSTQILNPGKDEGRRGPDFICIGAEKAGSTWLVNHLRPHRRISAPPLKELNYFNAIDVDADTRLLAQIRGDHWINRMWRHAFRHHFLAELRRGEFSRLRWYLRYFFGRRSDAWYRSLFSPGPGELSGEFTPNYSALSAAGVARAHAVGPDARILFIMRDPIDRGWSAAKMTLAGKPGRPFDSVSEEEFKAYLAGDWESDLGNYVRTVELWSQAYGADRVLVLFYDEIVEDPVRLLRRICEFLQLEWDPATAKDADRVINPSLDPDPIPEFAEQMLARKYEPMLERLVDLVDSEPAPYPQRWLDRARAVA